MTTETKRKSGRCPRCPYTVRLTKAGLIGSHILWRDGEPFHCDGWAMNPLPPKTP